MELIVKINMTTIIQQTLVQTSVLGPSGITKIQKAQSLCSSGLISAKRQETLL